MLDVAAVAIDQMIRDVRRLTRQRDRARAAAAGTGSARAVARRAGRRLRRRLDRRGSRDGRARDLDVDDHGVDLPPGLEPDLTFDVLVNDQHVWSFVPERDLSPKGRRGSQREEKAEDDPEAPFVPWPAALANRLRGRAEVALRHHVSGEVLARTDHVFAGGEDETASVTDRRGRPLIIDKYGRLSRPLSQQEPEIVHELLGICSHLLEVLQERAGVPAFVVYGTLLGAVRDQRLIKHDNDVDLAYLSQLPYPVDVAREGLRIERVLREAGYEVRRGSGVRLNARVKLSDGSLRGIDVFTAHWVEGVLYMPSDTGFRLPKETILPLGEVELHGHPMPAPNQPEPLLAATYGPGWRKPDPAFKYDTPRPLHRRINGWFGGLISHRKYWDAFYSQQRREVPAEPSPFATWVAEHHGSARPLVDVGCGTGRDSLWFASQGRHVVGMDYNQGVLRRATRRSERGELSTEFRLVNLYDSRSVLSWGAQLAHRDEPCDVYARFTLHALREEGRANLVRLASMALRREGKLFLEFRTTRDADLPHVFNHKRHFLAPDDVRELITAAGGEVVDQLEGRGMAPLASEDPHVCRMVATWSRHR